MYPDIAGVNVSDIARQQRIRAWLRHRSAAAMPYALFCAVVVWFYLPAEDPSGLMTRLAPAFGLLEVIGIGFSIRAATHRALDRRARRPWRLMIVCLVLLFASNAALGMGSRQGLDQLSPITVVGIGLRLSMVAVLLATLLSFAAEPLGRRGWMKVAFDVTTVIGGGVMALWYLVISPVLAGPNRGAVGVLVSVVAFMIGDLIILLGVSIVLFRGVSATARRPVSVLLLGALSYLGLDLYLAFLTAVGQAPTFSPLGCVAIVLPVFLLAVAASEQCRLAAIGSVAAEQQPFRTHTIVPYLGLAVGFGILGVAAARSGSPYPWAGLVAGAVVMTGGVAARQLVALRENHDLVVTDSLTGLANRLRLKEAMSRAAARSRRSGESMGILLIDMDDFKQINDTLGHDAGDKLLVAFGTVLRESVMSSDTTARLGGDEFAVLLDGVDSAEHATAVAERILTKARETVTYHGDTPMAMRASIGVAVANLATDTDVVDEKMLLHHADVAMYAAKRKRTQGWQLFTTDMDADTETRVLRTGLAHAVSEGQLRLEYQPIVALGAGDLIAFEALVRWQHPTVGLVLPATFIPLAEQTGDIHEIGAWVLEQACRQLLTWQNRLPPHRSLLLSVNISARQLESATLAEDILATLDRVGFSPRSLVLELTESALVDDRSTLPQLETLREHGIRVALDDFGTGYSSLRHLTRLPVDILKLDRCFVEELNGKPDGSAVAEAVIRLGQILHLDTVAEGIETSQQAAELELLGCSNAQGYHFARPLSVAAVDILLDHSDTNWPKLQAQVPTSI
jgi:diguanylate cyclase